MHFFIVVRTESLHRGKRGARGLTLGLTYPSGCLPICQGCFMWLKTIWLRVTINPNLHNGTPVICRQTRKCIKVFQFRVQGFICFLSHLLILYYAIRKQFYIFGHFLIVSCVLGVRGSLQRPRRQPWIPGLALQANSYLLSISPGPRFYIFSRQSRWPPMQVVKL